MCSKIISSNLVDASWYPQAICNAHEKLWVSLTATRSFGAFPCIHFRRDQVAIEMHQYERKLTGPRKERGAKKVRVSVHMTDWKRHLFSRWVIGRQVENPHSQLTPMYWSKQTNAARNHDRKALISQICQIMSHLWHTRKPYKHLYTNMYLNHF